MRVYVVVVTWADRSQVLHASESHGDACWVAEQYSQELKAYKTIELQTWCDGDEWKNEILYHTEG